MSGKSLLAKLLGTAAVSASAAAVATGKPGLSAEEQATGHAELERIAEAAFEEGKTAGMAEGRKAERDRFATVLNDEAAVGRSALAVSLLSTSDLAAETIVANLKASPTAAAGVAPAAAPAAPASAAEPPKQAVAKDPIAEATPTVDTGNAGAAAQASTEGGDQAQVDEIWKGALAGAQPFGAFAGFIPQRAN